MIDKLIFPFVIYGSLFFYLLRFIPSWNTIGIIYLLPLFYSFCSLVAFKSIPKIIFLAVFIFFSLMALQTVYRWGYEISLTYSWLRFFFGHLVFLPFFYLYYGNHPKRITSLIPLILKITLGEVILEFILINTLVPPTYLPNAPTGLLEQSSHFSQYSTLFGETYRPFGIGGFSQVTAPFLVALLAFYLGMNNRRRKALTVFICLVTIYLCGSGSGYFTLIICTFLFLLLSKKIITLLPVYISLGVLIFTALYSTGVLSTLWEGVVTNPKTSFYKIDPIYIKALFSFFVQSVQAYLSHLSIYPAVFFFGEPMMGESDSAILGFFKSSGSLFFLFYFISFIYFSLRYQPNAIRKRYYFIGMSALLVGSIHYPVLFAIPSQMIISALFAEGLMDNYKPFPLPAKG